MSLIKVNPTQRNKLAIATVGAALVGIWFLQHYIMLILFSVLVVILFNPLYHRFVDRGSKPQKAAFYTMLISALAVIIPLTIVSSITVLQIERLVSTISEGSYSDDVAQFANNVINAINSGLAEIGSSYRLSMEAIADALSSAVQEFGKVLLGGLLSSIGSFFGFITVAIIYIYVFMSMITHQDKIIDTLKKLNPLGDTASNLYIDRIGAMTKATVRGQFIIAFFQGTLSAVVLALLGFDDLFFFLWMLLTTLSVIPLGAGIVTIPIGIVMILTGNIWQGALVIINHLVVVTNIDNVLRPKLVPREARLDSALMILAVFAGLGMFGFIGIVLGPVLMIILVTTLQMYLEVFTATKSIDKTITPVEKNSLLRRIHFWKKA